MNKILSLLTLIFLSLNTLGKGSSTSSNYLANTLMIKVKPEYRSSCSAEGINIKGFQKLIKRINSTSCKKEFPRHTAPLRKTNAQGIPLVDISLIYKLEYAGNIDPKVLGPKLMATGFFEYAEPFFLHDVLYTPNDPDVGSQYHITNVKAYEAWNIEQGDSNFVVGISDTGIEYGHPDMEGNLKKNYSDPIDGIDNDNDGYIDNFRGWDLGDNDNDATWDVNDHGHYVAGTSNAITDNGNQVASPGFKSFFIPLKIMNSAGQMNATYPSIVYAADHNCKVINCSWGSANSWSQYGQDIITYAAINKECLVVCAAGNDNNEGIFYPASFDWALSVGGTNASNTKWVSTPGFGSNFNPHVDICAPGVNITTTGKSGGVIGSRNGTSFSAPIVAGASALIWNKYPGFSGMAVGELLKATADSLEHIPGNASYSGKLGEGLLNMERAVTELGMPGLYAYGFTSIGNNEGLMAAGDTVSIGGTIHNFLGPSSGATTVSLVSNSVFVKIINPTINIGAIATSTGYNLTSNPFKVEVLPGIPANEEVDFTFIITDGTYNTKRYMTSNFNIDYINVNVNQIGTMIGASGKLGYNSTYAPYPGSGVTYKGSTTMLYSMGFIASNGPSNVSFVGDNDFDTESDMKVYNPGVESNYDVHNFFNDAPAANSIGISVKGKMLAWSNPENEDFVIVEYKVINKSGATLNDLHLGIHADWDIGTYNNNQANFDLTSATGYCNEVGGNYGGIHLLDKQNTHHYAFDNDGSGGSVSIYDGFDENEQYSALTNGNSRPSSGINDISQMVGNGPFILANGDSLTFAFAIVAGDDLSDLLQNAMEADTIYKSIRSLDISQDNSTEPTCNGFCDGSILISASGGIGSYSYLWNDPAAQTTATASGLCSGTYSCIVTDSLGTSDTIKNLVLNDPAPVMVNLGNDTTLCGGQSVTFDAGNPGANYSWNTGGSDQTLLVSGAGAYNVVVTNGSGCEGKDTVNVFTGSSPNVNLGNDTSICSNTSLILDANNPGLSYLWSSGATGQTESFNTSGSHWVEVTNLSNCSSRDSLDLTVITMPSVDLGQDLIQCDVVSQVLDAGNPGATYLWSTGGTGQTVAISSSGTYDVTVTMDGKCVDKDTIDVSIEMTPDVDLGNDTAVCKNSAYTLDAGSALAHLWHTGHTTQTIQVNVQGKYLVTAGLNCTKKDSVTITFNDDPVVWYNSGFETDLNTDEGDVLLNFGRPEGGTYSGTGVSGTTFNTLSAGQGIHRIDYTYTDPSTGCSASTWLAVDVDDAHSPLALDDLDTQGIKVYPNPFNNQVIVSLGHGNHSKTNIQLFDGQGKLVFQGTTDGLMQQVIISTAHLSSGFYQLNIGNNTVKTQIKLIKQ